MDLTNLITCGPIVIICYVIGIGLKAFEPLDNKWIPCIVAVIGGLVGIPAMYLMQNFPANDIITAISIGCASGLVSVGANQIYKQATKKGE